jgi:hypothetical protein
MSKAKLARNARRDREAVAVMGWLKIKSRASSLRKQGPIRRGLAPGQDESCLCNN